MQEDNLHTNFVNSLNVLITLQPKGDNGIWHIQYPRMLVTFFFQICTILFPMFLQNMMDDLRSDWLIRLNWHEQLPDRLNFYCQDFQLIYPLTVNHSDQETLLER